MIICDKYAKISGMSYKLPKRIKGFIFHPKLNPIKITLEAGMPFIGSPMGNEEELRRERNEETLALANLNLQRDALQKNLILVHRSVMVALLATLVAVVLGIVAIRSKPSVIIKMSPATQVQKQ
jgi:hypothetical protein